MALPTIPPRAFYIAHYRASGSSTVFVGPFDTVDAAFQFSMKHGLGGGNVLGMIRPEDALDENGDLRQEVWH